MTSSLTSGAARQRARNKGLAWVSAITLGAGAASAIGAAAIAVRLPNQSAVASSATALAATTSTNAAKAFALHSGAAPTTSTLAPVATTGAS